MITSGRINKEHIPKYSQPTRVFGELSASNGWNENCQSVYVHVLFSLRYSFILCFLFPSITLGKKVFYVGVKLIICVYVNILKEKKNYLEFFFFFFFFFLTNNIYLTNLDLISRSEGVAHLGWLISKDRPVTSCTFCRSATMFVRSFCSFSSASFSLSSVLLLFSSTALALASARLW